MALTDQQLLVVLDVLDRADKIGGIILPAEREAFDQALDVLNDQAPRYELTAAA